MAFQKACCGEGSEDGGDERSVARMMGPGHIDQQVRQAIHMLWMILPPARKNADEIEREFRRVADRALRDLREDIKAFGIEP